MDLSPRQACLLWSELEQAYYGENRFGGDTAELYAYRFVCGTLWLPDGPRADAVLEATQNLYGLLVLFAQERECGIWVNGRLLGPWAAKEPFVHRVHVRVKRGKGGK